MDFVDQLRALSEKVSRLKDQIVTEEATKTAFVLPFIQLLGYDVFNPMEVVPEFVADLGIKKGEKVDYCIRKDGKPVIIVECKPWTEKLDPHNSQLFRYFHVTETRFAILTNGIMYRFYTDMEEPNKMDERPFMEFNFEDVKESLVSELKKFHKANFSVEEILGTASELKYNREIKSLLSRQLIDPAEPLVKFFAQNVYTGRVTPKVMEQFTSLVKGALNQFVSDAVTDRLKFALNNEVSKVETAALAASVQATDTLVVEEEASKIITTASELEAFYIVKSILREKVGGQRIVYRDAQTYFSILMDDNNRKPVCRLYLNGNKKMLALFDENKKEIKHELAALEDIYSFKEELLSAALKYGE